MIIFPVKSKLQYTAKYTLTFILITLLFIAIIRTPNASPPPTPDLKEKLAGQILIQVEDSGQAWYVHPQTYERYLLDSPQSAWLVLQGLSTTVDRSDWQTIKSMPTEKLNGMIVKIKQQPNIIYYFSPLTKTWYQLTSPTDVFNLIKQTGQGILNKDLNKIPTAQDK